MAGAKPRRFDLIAMGRAAVDFYGEQIGSRLEDMASFAKYLGGCAANIAVGSSRLGLKVAMLTRVGDEHMGRFVRESLANEGVDVGHVVTDPRRLTASVVLGIKDDRTFPHIFFRENCADMAIAREDFDACFIGSAKALLVVGTHFSTKETDSVCRAAMALARRQGTKIVFDIDYRPVLWGLASHGEGDARFIASDSVSTQLQSIVPECDLVVGTEEEMHIAGGATDTVVALRQLRIVTAATLVLKRGARGCVVFPGQIPGRVEEGITHPGFPTQVFNTLGAGDGFMSGFLSGWLRDEDWAECAKLGNACGSLVVARHGCAPAMPSRDELREFLGRAGEVTRPHDDATIAHIHRTTTGRRWPQRIFALAMDHRRHFDELLAEHGGGRDRACRFKSLLASSLERLPEAGAIVDDTYGRDALFRLSGTGRWIARPVEVSGSTLLQFEAGSQLPHILHTWPADHVIKCLVAYRADHPEEARRAQEKSLLALQAAAHSSEHAWLLEVLPPNCEEQPSVLVAAIERFYEIGMRPTWWKLPPIANSECWKDIAAVVRCNDPWCRGVLVLSSERPAEELARAFEFASQSGAGVGFAIGRSIWADVAQEWFAGRLDDRSVEGEIVSRFKQMQEVWPSA